MAAGCWLMWARSVSWWNVGTLLYSTLMLHAVVLLNTGWADLHGRGLEWGGVVCHYLARYLRACWLVLEGNLTSMTMSCVHLVGLLCSTWGLHLCISHYWALLSSTDRGFLSNCWLDLWWNWSWNIHWIAWRSLLFVCYDVFAESLLGSIGLYTMAHLS